VEQAEVSASASTKPLPRIALLGDSIRMSYQPKVGELLAGRAEVMGPTDNCRFALYTVERAPEWFAGFGKVDAVHWNNGLWDCGFYAYRGPKQFSLEDYITNLRTMLAALRKTHAPGAKIIWATCTPQHPARPFRPETYSWRCEDIRRYNAAAAELMLGEGVQINDLHAVISSNCDGMLSADQIHLSPDGVDACARAVVSALTLAGAINN
jgi:hypothetical protein